MSDNNEAQKLKQALAESAAFKWTMQRGINNQQAAQILANQIMDISVLSDGRLQDMSDRPMDAAISTSFMANALLRDNFADQVQQYEAQQGQQQAPAQPRQQQQTDGPLPFESKPYSEWSIKEKTQYRQTYSDEALAKKVIENMKAEREAKEN